MNYETQEEFEHFEGAMEQSVPQEECHFEWKIKVNAYK